MAKFTAENLKLLSINIKANDTIVNRAASLAINKTITFTKDLSTTFILQEVNLQSSYVKRKLKTAKRASPSDLVGVIRANTRETLLDKYKYSTSKEGVRVAINKKDGFKLIKRSFRVTNLSKSGTSGIAMRNVDAVAAFKSALSPATPAKSRKLQRIISNARTNPRGLTVLHSRSINQLFTSVRVDVQPRSERYMAQEFLSDLKRLQNG